METIVEATPRPSLADEYVRRRAAEIVLPSVLSWLGQDAELHSVEELTRDLMEVDFCDDGYEMSKCLERRRGWIADAALVNVLDCGWVEDALRELTEQWARCYAVRPALTAGDKVWAEIPGRHDDIGVIVGVDERVAKYKVHCPDQSEKMYCVVEFERVKAVEASAAA